MKINILRKKRQTGSVPLSAQQVNDGGSRIYRKRQLVGLGRLSLLKREEHGGGSVNDQLAAQVGLFFILLNKQSVGAGKQFPVQVLGRLARIVKAMLGKLHREPMKGTAVQPSDKAFDHLTRNQFKVIKLLEMFYVE